jgi:hypothetical protein
MQKHIIWLLLVALWAHRSTAQSAPLAKANTTKSDSLPAPDYAFAVKLVVPNLITGNFSAEYEKPLSRRTSVGGGVGVAYKAYEYRSSNSVSFSQGSTASISLMGFRRSYFRPAATHWRWFGEGRVDYAFSHYKHESSFPTVVEVTEHSVGLSGHIGVQHTFNRHFFIEGSAGAGGCVQFINYTAGLPAMIEGDSYYYYSGSPASLPASGFAIHMPFSLYSAKTPQQVTAFSVPIFIRLSLGYKF